MNEVLQKIFFVCRISRCPRDDLYWLWVSDDVLEALWIFIRSDQSAFSSNCGSMAFIVARFVSLGRRTLQNRYFAVKK